MNNNTVSPMQLGMIAASPDSNFFASIGFAAQQSVANGGLPKGSKIVHSYEENKETVEIVFPNKRGRLYVERTHGRSSIRTDITIDEPKPFSTKEERDADMRDDIAMGMTEAETAERHLVSQSTASRAKNS